MKINKFNESSETDAIKNEVKELFLNIWGSKLNLDYVSVSVYYPSKNAEYSIVISTKNIIDNDTYENFFELFNFLNASNVVFQNSRVSSQISMVVRDIDTFLKKMREKNDIKNYNL